MRVAPRGFLYGFTNRLRIAHLVRVEAQRQALCSVGVESATLRLEVKGDENECARCWATHHKLTRKDATT